MGSSTVTSPSPTMLLVLLPLVVVSGQDPSYCPDGWDLEWVHSTGDTDNGCRCFLFGPDEAVTRSTADLVCAGHSGSWVAELDHPGINYWMKAQLLKLIPVGERASFWLGGRTSDSHSPHQPGTWTWDAGHLNRTIEWFDWGDDEPNNFGHNEMCLTLTEYHDPWWPLARDYFWNDSNCAAPHHYICELNCGSY